MLVKRTRREGTLTLPSPAHDAGEGIKKNGRGKKAAAQVSVKKCRGSSEQGGRQRCERRHRRRAASVGKRGGRMNIDLGMAAGYRMVPAGGLPARARPRSWGGGGRAQP